MMCQVDIYYDYENEPEILSYNFNFKDKAFYLSKEALRLSMKASGPPSSPLDIFTLVIPDKGQRTMLENGSRYTKKAQKSTRTTTKT